MARPVHLLRQTLGLSRNSGPASFSVAYCTSCLLLLRLTTRKASAHGYILNNFCPWLLFKHYQIVDFQGIIDSSSVTYCASCLLLFRLTTRKASAHFYIFRNFCLIAAIQEYFKQWPFRMTLKFRPCHLLCYQCTLLHF